MLFRESETVELKEVVVDDIKKEIIAFANCDGGKLYIGVRDDGTVIGLDNADSVSLQISNMVRDAIKPDITMFLSSFSTGFRYFANSSPSQARIPSAADSAFTLAPKALV